MQVSLDAYYNLDYRSYIYYYLDFLAVSTSLLNILQYVDSNDFERRDLSFRLNKGIIENIELVGRLLQRLEHDSVLTDEKKADIERGMLCRG